MSFAAPVQPPPHPRPQNRSDHHLSSGDAVWLRRYEMKNPKKASLWGFGIWWWPRTRVQFRANGYLLTPVINLRKDAERYIQLSSYSRHSQFSASFRSCLTHGAKREYGPDRQFEPRNKPSGTQQNMTPALHL